MGSHQYPIGFCVGIQDNLVSEEPTITKKFPHYKEICWTEKCPNERVGIWNRWVATNIYLDHCSSSSATPIFLSMYVMVVSVFHSCASSTIPLQLHNSTMFLEVTWTSSSKLGHTSWLELWRRGPSNLKEHGWIMKLKRNGQRGTRMENTNNHHIHA